MQLQGFLFMFLMLILFPVVILTSHHEVFFVILSIILFISSARNIHSLIFYYDDPAEISEEEGVIEEEERDDFNSLLNLDFTKIETGLKTVYGLIVFLFFAYCIFFVNNIWVKIFILAIALYQIYDIISMQKKDISQQLSRIKHIELLLVNISILVIVLITACNKYIKNII